MTKKGVQLYIIEMRNITKRFPGVLANDNVTLQLKKGEIHALLGENGAGKSTLMSILFGLYKPDGGVILKNGEEVSINGPGDATRLGVGMVHQHFKLVHNFTVLENIILGAENSKFGFLSMESPRKRVEELSEEYGLAIDLDKRISDITVGMQQRVEILKMLYRNNEILIFDEPTAVLTPGEIDSLIETMRGMTKLGKSILFITHKLDEIKSAADRCSVLRRGKYIGTVDVADVSKEDLSEMMVGRQVALTLSKEAPKIGETVLSVKGLTKKGSGAKNKLTNISFEARAGEILCIAGIEGNGQTDLVYALTGLDSVDFGTIELLGQNITNASIRRRGESGMAHIPEDRHKHGLVLDYNLALNAVLQSYFKPEYQKAGVLRFENINEEALSLIKDYDIRAGDGYETITRSMSGGNQQKLIVAREINRTPKLLIAVQPTRGLDVGAIEYIHGRLLEQRDSGVAVLIISLELEEVINISDRILVMYEGEIVADVDPAAVTYQELGLYMSGAKRNINYIEGTHENS